MQPSTIAVVGTGHWGSNLVRNFAALGALRAVVDDDPSRAQAAAAAAGVSARTLDDVLTDPSIDAVAIATPAITHAKLALRAIESSKHVFVEKPLALNVEDGRAVCDAAKRQGRVLMVGHLLRYHPAFQALQRRVVNGDLGRLQYLASTRLNFGRFRQEENSLWSFAPHDISMILALVGEEPDTVLAVGSTHLHPTRTDVTTTHLSFPSGQGAHVHVSWLHPIKEQKLVVVGNEGMAVFDDTRPSESKLQLFRHRVEWSAGMPVPAKAEAEPIEIERAEPLEAECRHFLECVAAGQRPMTDGEEGLRVLSVLQRAQHSLRPATPNTSEFATVPTSGGGSSTPEGVHPTATVDPDVSIGTGTKVWHYSHLLNGTRVGRDCVLGQNVMVGPNVQVGDGCRIQNNVSIYEGITLEDRVFCGPSMVFTNVLTPRAGVDRRGEFSPTLVRAGATIGANATIVCGVTLGEYSMVAAGAVVTKDVASHALVMGVPARQVGWVSHAGERLGDDMTCPRTGQKYRLEDGRLITDD